MAECFTMQYAMSELLGAAGKEARREQNLLESEEKGEDKMYVLSNRARSNGAACMIYPYVLRMMGDILEEDFYILPSSIHEVILVPASAGWRRWKKWSARSMRRRYRKKKSWEVMYTGTAEKIRPSAWVEKHIR